MKTLTTSFLFLLFISFIGCSPSSSRHDQLGGSSLNIPIINIDSGLKNISNTPFKCSEFIDDILFIPLETNKESLLGNGKFAVKILPASEFIYCDLKKFRLMDGRFINSIGKKGRGPGEFPLAIGSTTDIKDNRVFILANGIHQVLIYDSNNVFIKKVDVLPEIQGITYIGDDNLVLFRDATSYLTSFTIPFEYQILNLKEERIIYTREIKYLSENLKNRKEKFLSFGIGRNCNWLFDNKVQYYESFTDTIFTIDRKGSRIPRFYINRGNIKPPISEILDNETFNRNRSKYVTLTSFFETPRFIFFNLKKGLIEGYIGRFDKFNLETIIVPSNDAFENDLSIYKIGYISNMPGSSDGVEYLDSPFFKEDFLSRIRNIPQSEWNEHAKILYDLLTKANPEDNGIICIYKFKK